MIREVRQEDAAAIAAINNLYVMHSDASFDTCLLYTSDAADD